MMGCKTSTGETFAAFHCVKCVRPLLKNQNPSGRQNDGALAPVRPHRCRPSAGAAGLEEVMVPSGVLCGVCFVFLKKRQITLRKKWYSRLASRNAGKQRHSAENCCVCLLSVHISFLSELFSFFIWFLEPEL